MFAFVTGKSVYEMATAVIRAALIESKANRVSGSWYSGCGRSVSEIAEVCEREIRDLPCFEYRATVVVELYRLRRTAGGDSGVG